MQERSQGVGRGSFGASTINSGSILTAVGETKPMSIHATLEERGVNYGSFEDRCRVEQTIKRAFASGHQWAAMPDDCRSALEMIATKVSRIVAGNNPEHHDS
jgi:hypothetical protein